MFIPKSIFPFVPQALGVPALLRGGAQIIDTLTLGYLGVSDALNEIIGAEPVKWGVFNEDGKKVADYDSVFATGYQNDSHVSDYPIEGGRFASYNKVESPFGVSIVLNRGGSEEERANFQTEIIAALKSLDKYTVLTPTHTYYDINFVGLSWNHSTQDGAHRVSANITGREVRDFGKADYSSPKDVSGFDPKAQGQLQLISDPTLDVSDIA